MKTRKQSKESEQQASSAAGQAGQVTRRKEKVESFTNPEAHGDGGYENSLSEMIRNSPRQVAQAKLIQRLFSPPEQKTGVQAGMKENTPLQRKHSPSGEGVIQAMWPFDWILERIGDWVFGDLGNLDIDITEEELERDLMYPDNPDIQRVLGRAPELSEELKGIISETIEAINDPNFEGIDYGPSGEGSEANITFENHTRKKDILINDRILTNKIIRESIILHELMHLVSNEKYDIQNTGNEQYDVEAYNFHDPSEQPEYIETTKKMGKVKATILELKDTLDHEQGFFSKINATGHFYEGEIDDLYNYIKRRLKYMDDKAYRETDAVLTELFYLLEVMGKSHPKILVTETYKFIRNWSINRARYRNKE
ncbi:MAG: flagellar protein FliS [bacterium]|nr:flagellar protein FliS [bacterium]